MRQKVYVLGASGFVGSKIFQKLQKDNIECLGVSRKDLDFLNKKDITEIISNFDRGSVIVLAFAKAPTKNTDDLFANISMAANVVEAVESITPSYILNISSDAVYSDSITMINEDSFQAPRNLHGVMHVMRENILNQKFEGVIGHLRPTLIFGEDDPHNGYGPNSFLRKAVNGQDISIYGHGEEKRDHIYINDVIDIATQMIVQRYNGSLNATTGTVITFSEIAEKATELFNPSGKIIKIPRNGEMPHNGYRAFDNSALLEFLPHLRFLSVFEYFRKIFDAKV